MNTIDWNELKNSDNVIISNLAYLVKDNEKGVQVDNDTTIRTTEDIVNWVKTLSFQGVQGPQGPQGPKGDTGTFNTSTLENYATKTYVNQKISSINNSSDIVNNYIYNTGEDALIYKTRQLIDIKWTPKRPIPRCKKRDTSSGNIRYISSGQQCNGIPYAATQQIDKVVGYDVSPETFMTAINNYYSLIYTEVIRPDNDSSPSKSDWFGSNYYHGYNSTGAYYGIVCAEFCSYCAGLPMPHKTTSIAPEYINNVKNDQTALGITVGYIFPYEYNSLKPGDIIWKKGHCIIVSNVNRDDCGNIIGITICEASSTSAAKTRRIVFGETNTNGYEPYSSNLSHYLITTYFKQISEFSSYVNDELLKNNERAILRNINFKDNKVKFTWNIDNQDNYNYNNDICTFAGDKACFREGELIVLNYGLEGHFDSSNNWISDYDNRWTHIELYKNDNLINTYQISSINQSELPDDQKNHAIKLPTNLTYGDYKARVIIKSGNNITSSSDYTYFKIIETYVQKNNNKYIFSSHNATPIAVRFTAKNGGVRKEYILTDDQISNGYAIFDYSTTYETYLKVYFECDYGRVTNNPIILNSGNGEGLLPDDDYE